MTVGVYILKFKGTDKVYIGKSINIETRLRSHISHIKEGTGSKKLTQAFKTYGVPSIETLIECSREELSDCETEAINIYNSVENGFNTLELSDEMPSPDNSGELNGMASYSNEEIISIFEYITNNLDKRYIDISKELDVPYNLVISIARGINHRWLEGINSCAYNAMLSNPSKSNGKSALERGITYPTIVHEEYGEANVINVRQFALENGLDRGCLNKLLNGKVKSCKGWKIKT